MRNGNARLDKMHGKNEENVGAEALRVGESSLHSSQRGAEPMKGHHRIPIEHSQRRPILKEKLEALQPFSWSISRYFVLDTIILLDFSKITMQIGPLGDCLQYDTVSLCELQQCIQLVLRCIGIHFERHPDLLEAHRGALVHTQSSP